jgi:hypothetical protein
MNTKREMKYKMSEQFAIIQHFNAKNPVVINRYENMYGITLEMLVEEANELVSLYNRKFGKRFGNAYYWVVVDGKAYKKVENNFVEIN